MATYNTAFGSLPGYNEMLGTTNTTGGGQQQVYGQRAQQQRQQQQQPAPAQTFAQMQQRGMARPAPPSAPQAQPFAQYGGSQQAQQMRQRLQSQLEQFGQAPSRFDTQAFQQIRGAQAANLQQEYQGQLKALNEDLARRGLSASSVGGGRMGDLAGQQARALASLDAELLQRAAETQAQDRAQLLSEGRGLAELASSQDLAQFEANRVAQAATFENQLRAAQFGQQQFEQAGQEAFQGAQAEEAAQQAARAFDLQATGQAAGLSMDLQRLLGQQEIERAQLTGQLGGAQTLAAQQQAEQRRQFDIQQALQAQLGLGGLEVQRGQLDVEQQRLAQQGEQFLAQLDEQQAARLQQGGFTTTELAIKRSQVDNELALQNRQLSETERNNLAIRNLEKDRFDAQQELERAQLTGRLGTGATAQDTLAARQFALQEELQRAGLTGRLGEGATAQDTLAAQQQQFQQRQVLYQQAQQMSQQSGVQYTVNERGEVVPLRDAQGNVVRTSDFTQAAEARKLQSEELTLRRQLGLMEATGQGLTVDAEGRIVAGTGPTAQTLQARQIATQERQLAFQNAARLSEQSGVQYTVDDSGNVVPLRDAQGNAVRTSAETQAAEARKLQSEELTLRRQLGLMEATGQGLTVDAEGRIVAGTGATAQTVQARQLAFQNAARLSEQSGVQYTVDASGQPVVLRDAQGNPVRTSAFTQADEARKQQQEQFNISQFGRAGEVQTGAQTLAALQQQLQQAGITGTFQGRLTQEALQNAYARAAQLSQATGQQYTVNPYTGDISAGGDTLAARLQQAQVTGTFGGVLTQEALQNAYARAAQLSQTTGQQYTVDQTGRVVPTGVDTISAQLQRAGMTGMLGAQETLDRARLTGTIGGQATLERLQQSLQQAQIMSQMTGQNYYVDETGRARSTGELTQAARQFNLEQSLRQALGMSELSGTTYSPFTSGTSVGASETFGKTIARREADIRQQLGLSELFGQLYIPDYGAFQPGQETIGRQTARSQQTIAEAQQRMAQDELQSRLREQLIRVLSSFPIPTATK